MDANQQNSPNTVVPETCSSNPQEDATAQETNHNPENGFSGVDQEALQHEDTQVYQNEYFDTSTSDPYPLHSSNLQFTPQANYFYYTYPYFSYYPNYLYYYSALTPKTSTQQSQHQQTPQQPSQEKSQAQQLSSSHQQSGQHLVSNESDESASLSDQFSSLAFTEKVRHDTQSQQDFYHYYCHVTNLQNYLYYPYYPYYYFGSQQQTKPQQQSQSQQQTQLRPPQQQTPEHQPQPQPQQQQQQQQQQNITNRVAISPFDKLSTDIIVKIFSFLPDYITLIKVSEVCKKWFEISTRDELWEPLAKKYYLYENGTFKKQDPKMSWRHFFQMMLVMENEYLANEFDAFEGSII